ncbi:hypothetical protein ACOSP7_019133 [Xanthoceras sorbifolium]
MSSSRYTLLLLLLLLFVSVFLSLVPLVRSGDAEALLSLKSSIDPLNTLSWKGTDFCKWQGIKECMNGRVTKLVLEYLNLTGTLDENSLNQLDQLRVVSFKGNSISGQLPNFSGLFNLKSLYLNHNNFSGKFPESLSTLHRLKVIVLADNQISGSIPLTLVNLRRLYMLNLQDNKLSGPIPALNQTSLRFFNVSNNQLSGKVPLTAALVRFNTSSFLGNVGLCGEQIENPCEDGEVGSGMSPPDNERMRNSKSSKRSRIMKIVGASVGGFIFVVICMMLLCLWLLVWRRRRRKGKKVSKGEIGLEREEEEEEEEDGSISRKQVGFSWENEGLGSLVLCGGGDEEEMMMSYSLEELLKASAETLGRGSMGSTYKAILESGYILTVKRLKNARHPRLEEFRRHMDIIGRLRHPNVVPLRAYFQAKEERLLVYDYFPNGSLFSLIHGSRSTGGGKPLHWTSCLKIAEDLASGLLYIHQNPGLTHGNLKSTNVLLGTDFESCLTDYGLTAFRDPDSLEETSAASMFYRAPECRDMRKPPTQQADVYSFGYLLLELLTGKTPFQDLVQEHGSDIPRWVRSVREEETESGDEPASCNEASEEKLQALLNIAMACVSLSPENRPVMREVLKMIRDARAEAQMSSNSSDHSPGRWSDTVQSLPREEHLSI